MGIFARIAGIVAEGAGRVGAAFGALWSALASLTDSDLRRRATFAVAMIALSAKMAKADGVVVRAEVEAFTRVFAIAPAERAHVGRIYDLAQRDVAGFEFYARSVAGLLGDSPAMLEDVLDGLFEIAKADGAIHERELAYLTRVGEILGFSGQVFDRISSRHTADSLSGDPYLALGADRAWDFETLRRHYRRLVSENHPDRQMALGLPEEFVRIATDRLAAINAAWERIEAERRPAPRAQA